MVWSKKPYEPESKKLVWELAPYLRGPGLDIGAGCFKILPHAVSVDNGIDHQLFGIQFKPDIYIQNAEDMSQFGSQSWQWVYSSHLLEHLEKPAKALREWWRLVKQGGYLILYLPHEDLYPKVGTPEANVDHKMDLNEQKVIDWMKEIGPWDLERCEQRNEEDEYSFLMIFRKEGKTQTYSYKNPKPEKTACVVRYGAFGDMIQTSTIYAGLKKQGYHVTTFCSPPGSDVILNDPNVDKIVLFDKDQVPNADLGSFWNWQKKNFDKFVNLSETVEGTFLAMNGRIQFQWPPEARHAVMNRNYIEFMHAIAGLPHEPNIKFYPTAEERSWAKKQRDHIKFPKVIMWSLAGSSVHKTWAGLDNIMASVFLHYPETAIVLVGGPECVMLEGGWEHEPRVFRTSGKWTIRQTLAMLDQVDLLIGPETGVLNAAACMSLPKVVFLSHSTHENLSRDWVNITPLASKNTTCPGRGRNEAPACHMLHFGFDFCRRDEGTGTAQCQADITVEQAWNAIDPILNKITERVAA